MRQFTQLKMFVASVALACGVSTSQAQLVNASFETPGSGTTWDGWINFDNAFAETGAFRTGATCVKAFGNGTTDFNASGVYQQLPTTANQAWEAKIWVFNPSGDAIQGANFGALNIEWIDAFGSQLGFQTTNAATASTPTNQWREVSLIGVAPAGAAFARITLLHIQAPGLLGGSVYFDDASLEPITLTGLRNTSFEIAGPGGPNVFLNWVNFGNVFSDGTIVKSGSRAAKMFGNFSGAFNPSGVYQDFAATPGETWQGKGWVGTVTADRIRGDNFAALNIEWLDQFGTQISFVTSFGIDGASTPDVMHEVNVSGVAPPGTVTARIVPIHIQGPALAGGAVWWDDIEFASVPSGCDSIDFNRDTLTPDSGDLDDFIAVLAGGPGACSNAPNCGDIDFNNDGLSPDSTDLDAFISRLGGGPCL
jgi:hypothetical protein